MSDDDLHDFLRAHESADTPHFSTDFADRVMRRVLEQPAATFDLVLVRHARRVLPALAAASLLLAAWNYASLRDRTPSAIGALLGMAGTNTSGVSNADAFTVRGLVNIEAFQ